MDGAVDCREDEQDVPDLHPVTIALGGQAYQFPLIALATSMAITTAKAQPSKNWRRVGINICRP